jgi:hypothetical protein
MSLIRKNSKNQLGQLEVSDRVFNTWVPTSPAANQDGQRDVSTLKKGNRKARQVKKPEHPL